MRLVCPHCGKAHLIKAEVIGSGRNVRCAACQKTWFVSPESDGQSAPVLSQAKPQAPAPKKHNMSPEAVVEQVRNVAGPLSAQDKSRRKVSKPAKKPSNFKLEAGPALVLGLVAALLAGIVMRESVVRAAPGMARLYAAIGLNVNIRGLDFIDVASRADIENGQPMLTIEGKIVNRGSTARKVPSIKVLLRSPSGAEAQSAVVNTDEPKIGPRSDLSFKVKLANPPSDAKDILVRFFDDERRAGG